VDPLTTPTRLKSLPTWLINQLSIHAHRVVAEHLRHAHVAHRYHYSLLAALAENGPASQADLGRRVGLDRSDVTAAINDLAERGAVERTADASDRRRNVVSLTDDGTEHLEALERLIEQAQDELLAPLSEGERSELVRMLNVLVEHHSPTEGTSRFHGG
jgi:MarR family transcriptional regulator, lower aerobic nicotinate degradation pathway regulator